MKDTNEPKPIHLKDYKKPDYLVDNIHLTFELDNTQTKVTNRMSLKAHPEIGYTGAPLALNGEELKLISIKLNDEVLNESDYRIEENLLVLPNVPERFQLEVVTEINPEANKALDGLYKSGSIFCTQNEPEGFRRITYYLDRPDVMTKFKTKIIADKKLYPVLLSNGNPIGQGDLEGGRHWVEWEDPFKKPCYLYALVAGDLGLVQDSYTTSSGREIDLRIYCDPGNEDRCDHAMESLKKSMKWDEDRFGLEYDLDIYMIVAVDSFNMGAMENKGLNVFNSALVLAKPETATDDDYYAIESVIGHEYFHNWTGNRVTCRDWFQLTLKEGLTVFRDQEFSSDMNAEAVNRINMVRLLRSHQFREDSGPTAHPIKPASYIEMNNFYTATVYNKGAEVIRMLNTFFGKEGFRKGMDKYFELYDGQAVTTEDFLHAMSIANNDFDMTQFKNWYSQAGTPKVLAKGSYDSSNETYTLSLEQSCPATPGQEEKEPFHMPLRLGLLNSEGQDMAIKDDVIHLKDSKQEFTFKNITEKPCLSINRGFSAPINLEVENSNEELAFLMGNDSDEFNRFEASQTLGQRVLESLIAKLQAGEELFLEKTYLEAYGKLLNDESIDNEFKALSLGLPTEDVLHLNQSPIDFESTHQAREFALISLSQKYKEDFLRIYQQLSSEKAYDFNPQDMGERSLKNRCLMMLCRLNDESMDQLAFSQFEKASNMTEQLSALAILCQRDCSERKKALNQFAEKWKNDGLVMQKWFAVQASSKLERTYDEVVALTEHELFDINVPNFVRSLLRVFARNSIHLHHKSGRGYKFMADMIIKLNSINPQIAAGLAGAFSNYKKLGAENQEVLKVELERISETKDLSRNVYEIISKILA